MDKLIAIIFILSAAINVYADEVEIPPSLIKQVESGNAESAFFIATAFAEGSMGIEQNLEKAKEWFMKSAEMGYVHGMFEVGKLLYEEKLFAEAKPWFEKASKEGHGQSFYRLSLYSIYGLNNEAFDCEKSYKLLEKAMLRDVKSAFNDYAWMLSTLPDKKCRNGQKAWRIFSNLQDLYSSMEPIPWAYLDTKAAVLAEISEYNGAIEVQSWIVEDFCDIDFTADDESFKLTLDKHVKTFTQAEDDLCLGAIRRLQSYVNRQPWREEPVLYNE